MAEDRYFRVHTQDIAWATQRPRGLFVAVGKLVQAGTMTEAEVAEYWETRRWFEAHLPVPPFYAAGNPEKAITWFRDTPQGREMFAKMGFYRRMAHQYRIDLWVTTTTGAPGRIVYEDDWQVAVVESGHAGLGFATTPLTVEGLREPDF